MYSVFVHGEGCWEGLVNLSCRKVKEVHAILGDKVTRYASYGCVSGGSGAILSGK
jgi:hypothetical protein